MATLFELYNFDASHNLIVIISLDELITVSTCVHVLRGCRPSLAVIIIIKLHLFRSCEHTAHYKNFYYGFISCELAARLVLDSPAAIALSRVFWLLG